MLPVRPRTPWKMTSSIRLPVSTRTEAMIVREPASSGLAGGGEEPGGAFRARAHVEAARAGLRPSCAACCERGRGG